MTHQNVTEYAPTTNTTMMFASQEVEWLLAVVAFLALLIWHPELCIPLLAS
jgi:hypothetical protein